MLAFPRRYNAAAELLHRHVDAGRGARVAYTDDRESVTYAALAERANRAGNALLASGARREERVLMLMLDTVDFPAVFLGAMKAGLVPVPVNTLLTAKDYAYMLADSRARVVVVSDALLPKLEEALAAAKEAGRDVAVIVASTPSGAQRGEDGERSAHLALEPALASASTSLDAADTTPDDAAFWLYSSGSTGAPKGAVHLHASLAWTAELYAKGVLGMREDDVVFSAAKLFFAYGLGNALTFPLTVGAHAVLTAERPTPATVARVMKDHAPTIFCGVPTLYATLLASKEFEAGGGTIALPKLRVSISAGEALPKHVGEAWRARFGTDILDGIGSTEMLHIFLSNREGALKYGTSGKPVPGYEAKLVGDDGEPVPDGEEGSLWVKGPSACACYWNQRERSLATFHGPWTRTGDRYVKDADGYYVYSGRADDMLKVGGIWVSPFEVESALAAHEAVLEAAVVGAEDADGLVKPKAFVVLKDAAKARAGDVLAAELKAFVKGTLAPYKYPRWVEFPAELPKTATGKIQRFRLRG
jgi:benzoate-CoA ligase family protein